MNHTKLPWMAYGTGVITGNDIGPIDARTREDAAFIVTAANHHEELIAIVKRYVAWQEGNFDAIDIEAEILNPARAILQRIEKE